jgi:hypothetical protein
VKQERAAAAQQQYFQQQEQVAAAQQRRYQLVLSLLAPGSTSASASALSPSFSYDMATLPVMDRPLSSPQPDQANMQQAVTVPRTAPTEPFRFDRDARTVRAILAEVNRYKEFKKFHRRLGYDNMEQQRSEDRYTNERITVAREIEFLQTEGVTLEEAIELLQRDLSKSLLTVVGYLKMLRDRQKTRDVKGKAKDVVR